jgi:AraC-like DNA-binding protein
MLLADPSNRQSLARICKTSGASGRTVEQLFHDETGMTFGKWRQQLRMMQAMRLLGEGAKVTHAALEAGYSTPSALEIPVRGSSGESFVCQHRSHGRFQLAGGRLNPPEEFHRGTLDKLRRCCSFCMLFLKERGIEHGSIFIKLQNLFELGSGRGATVNNVFAIKAPMPDGDGKSKETAYFFSQGTDRW